MNNEHHPKILIIDDSFINNLLFQDILKEAGFKVTALSSSKKAFLKVKENQPDIIILDIMMPEVDGLAVLEQIKTSEETKNIPILMVTADTKSDSMKKAQQLGAVDYITKPIIPEDLVKRVKKALKDFHDSNLL
jgi:PleD family two-component response regulator